MSIGGSPTAAVKQFAASQPGSIISRKEVQAAYATGLVRHRTGAMVPAAAHHNMTISNVLYRNFVRVEGARGLWVLRTSMNNYDVEGDDAEAKAFHETYGCDEFGMSTRECPLEELAGVTDRPLTRSTLLIRMSDILDPKEDGK